MVTGHLSYHIVSVFLPKLLKIKQCPLKLGQLFIDNVSIVSDHVTDICCHGNINYCCHSNINYCCHSNIIVVIGGATNQVLMVF